MNIAPIRLKSGSVAARTSTPEYSLDCIHKLPVRIEALGYA
jgi:hypothetical protein